MNMISPSFYPSPDAAPSGSMDSMPGREHFIVLPDAGARGQALEFRASRDVVLHIKPSLAHGALVVNAHQAGRWATEKRLPLPRQAFEQPLDLFLHEEGGSAVISAAEQSLSFALARPLAGARLFLPQNIIRWPDDPSADVLHGQITIADLQHAAVAIQRRGGASPGRTSLILRAGGRAIQQLDLPPQDRSRFATHASFRLMHRPEVMRFEGMPVELLAETEAGSRVLDRTIVESRLLGAVEQCSAGLVRGWARNPSLPHQPLLLDIHLNGRFQGVARANLPHAGHGPAEGPCGFRFILRDTAALRMAAEVLVSVRVHDTDLELTHSPWWIKRPPRAMVPLATLQPAKDAP